MNFESFSCTSSRKMWSKQMSVKKNDVVFKTFNIANGTNLS